MPWEALVRKRGALPEYRWLPYLHPIGEWGLANGNEPLAISDEPLAVS
jgi:hypothetical protein